MTDAHFILNLAIAIGIALVGGVVAHRLRLSPLAGYLVAGIVAGPFATGFLGDRTQISAIAEVGVIFLMFAIGIEFSLKDLGSIKVPAIAGTLLQMTLLIAAGTAGGLLLGWTLGQSIFFGGVISISSTMVILKTLMDRGEMSSKHGRLLLGMLVVQDLAVIPLILILPLVAGGGSLQSSAIEALVLLAKALVFVGVILFLGAKIVPRLFAYIGDLGSSEIFFLTAVALALGSAALSTLIGLSPALGAFLAGMLLTESEFEHRIISELVPMRDLFAALFFVSMGMLINWQFVLQYWWLALSVAAFILVVKVLLTGLALLPFRLGTITVASVSLGMIPIGEFNFVLAQTGRTSGALSTNIYNLILAAALPTIILTPLGMNWAKYLARKMCDWPLLGKLFTPQVQITDAPSEELRDHAVVIGYGRVGKRVARGLRQAGLVVNVVEREFSLVRELQKDKFMAIYGDATYSQVLDAASPHAARIMVVALPDFGATHEAVLHLRKVNSKGIIVARADRSEHDAKLRDAGATAVVVPEMAGAFMFLDETLILLGMPHEHIFTGISSLRT
ncbi:MAG: cation:proton antiporter [Abditibacteriaceae bacterium]